MSGSVVEVCWLESSYKDTFVFPRIVMSGAMNSVCSVLYSAEELQELVQRSVACVSVERRVQHIALLSHCLRDVKSAIRATLNLYQNKFHYR